MVNRAAVPTRPRARGRGREEGGRSGRPSLSTLAACRPERAPADRAGPERQVAGAVRPGAEGGESVSAPGDKQLLEHVVHVVLHRWQLDLEALGDLLVGEPGVDERDDLGLARREVRRTRRAVFRRCTPALSREDATRRSRIAPTTGEQRISPGAAREWTRSSGKTSNGSHEQWLGADWRPNDQKRDDVPLKRLLACDQHWLGNHRSRVVCGAAEVSRPGFLVTLEAAGLIEAMRQTGPAVVAGALAPTEVRSASCLVGAA